VVSDEVYIGGTGLRTRNARKLYDAMARPLFSHSDAEYPAARYM
jgi:hypothetical protein